MAENAKFFLQKKKKIFTKKKKKNSNTLYCIYTKLNKSLTRYFVKLVMFAPTKK